MDLVINPENSSSCKFFTNKESQLIEKFVDESGKVFTQSGVNFQQEYISHTNQFKNASEQQYSEKMKKLETLFKMYCILKNKCHHKQVVNEQQADYFYLKNLLKNTFKEWSYHSRYNKYLVSADNIARREYTRRFTSKFLQKWRLFTMEEIKVEIKYNSVRKTETEINKIQKEYESLIKNLERTLETRLYELKQEEESHKLLYKKYDMLAESEKSVVNENEKNQFEDSQQESQEDEE